MKKVIARGLLVVLMASAIVLWDLILASAVVYLLSIVGFNVPMSVMFAILFLAELFIFALINVATD